MSAADACPPLAELESLLLGRLPPVRAAAVHRHVGGCSMCPARLDGLKLESRLMKLLTDRPPTPAPVAPPPPGLLSLMSELEKLVPGTDRPRDFDTPTTAVTAVTEDGMPFLHPPKAAGELGRLADYRVRRLLGRGGMGLVFRADDARLDRPVGLKVLRPRVARDPAARARFLREARAMAAVRHDHIAVVHEVGVAPGADGTEVPFLAMELLDGQSLLEWMRANPKPPAGWVARIGRQAAAGLAAAHAVGLVHRDVKPSNLWLESPPGWLYDPPADRPPLGAVGRVKLIDFGMAAPATDRLDGVAGTPAYMAPEQFRGDPPDARCDLFALGCVLYELAAGEHPFPGRGPGTVFTGDPTPAPPRDLNPAVPNALSDLITELLADEPDARPASAREVEKRLAAIETTLTAARPPRRWAAPAALALAAALVAVSVGINVRARQLAAPLPPIIPPPEAAARPPADDGLFPDGPPDERWCQRVADLPSQDQFRIVSQKLAELNPGYNPDRALGWVERELVIRFTVVSDAVRDIRPVRGLPDVKTVRVAGTAPGTGVFTDLTPLTGLRLYTVLLDNNPKLTDLSPLRGTRLRKLELTNTGVTSLADLDGELMEDLILSGAPIRDLTPIRAMPRLKLLKITGCPVASLEPLAGTPVRFLAADVRPDRDGGVIRRMPQLAFVNGRPVREFWSPPAAPATKR